MESAYVFALALITSGLPHDVVAGCADEPAADLNDIGRRDSNISWTGGTFINDYVLTPGWYRAVHNGWQYFMTDSTILPDYTMCNTYWPIYLKGSHPSYDSITEVPVSYTACLRDYLYPCSTTFLVKIRKCDNEVHYYLQSTRYFSAYCFDKHKQVDEIPNAPTDVDLGQVTVKPQLHFLTNTYTQPREYHEYIPYLKFVCNFRSQSSYFYTVHWYVDGAFLTTIGPTQNLSSLSIDEDFLINRTITLGAEFHCGVGVSSVENGKKTDVVFSSRYYAGMKVLNSTVFLEKGKEGEVLMQSTIPIGCLYNDLPEMINSGICENSGFIQMFVNDRSEFSCTTQATKGGLVSKVVSQTSTDQCSSGFETLSKNKTWDPDKIHRFKIVTTDVNYEDSLEFNLKLQFNPIIPHPILRNFHFPNIKVFIRDNKSYQSKICYSKIDPHMRTADNYYFEQQKRGYFMLYENEKYGIEVQERTTPCNNNYATCTCGVIVRAGRDVFMINQCGNLNFFDFISCGDGGILQVQKVHTHLYNIYTPIGTKIAVTLHTDRVYLKTMNVEITMAPKDVGNVRGLCGYFDSDKSNDLRHIDGKSVSRINNQNWKNEHYSFSDSWSLLHPLQIEKNLFDSPKRNLDSWQQQNGLFCVCGKNAVTGKSEAVCAPSQYLNCNLAKSITENKCRVTNRRRRSSEAAYSKELERLYSLMKPTSRNAETRHKRQDTTNITHEEATSFCTNKINGSLAVQSYGEMGGNENPDAVISQCAFDVEVGNDLTVADAHVESVNNIVKTMMEKEPSYVQNNTEKVEIFLLNTCPGNCSGNGNCTKSGECACEQYYHGSDCTIDERNALVIDDIEGGGECDLADGRECTCFKIRSNNILEGLKCSVNTTKVSTEGEEEVVSSQSFAGSFEDVYTAECCISDNIAGNPDVFVAKYGVRISNNGLNYSNVAAVYVYDSTCQNVSAGENGTKQFNLKDDYCFLEGHCVRDGEMSIRGCLACKTTVSVLNWTFHNPCENGGDCMDTDAGYICVCQQGYEGTRCQKEIDECLSSPCKNGGSCTDRLNGYTCTCTAGYNGSHCQNDINECHSSPCENGASCTDLINGYRCDCVIGFTGNRCETDIDECASSPCADPHVCKDSINTFSCQCADGYTGNTCEIEIDECVSRPCANGGTCNNKVNGYTCNCMPGYNGTRCDHDIDECAAQPCKNGGTCTDRVNEFTCDCLPGFNGLRCENDIDECVSNPCDNGGTCQNAINGYTCTCVPGYSGIQCKTDIDECASNPCENGGTCTNLLNKYICTCVTGYYGDRCETDIDECSLNPCLNEATCTDKVNGYICACQPGYVGTQCETDVDDCSSSPCVNAGSCIDRVNGYTCNCAPGYNGTRCENDIDECPLSSCKNGGTCIDRINGYVCACPPGFTGTLCELDIDECASNPCNNGGNCKDQVNGYMCTCMPGYIGLHCQTDVDECASSPCRNNGKCSDHINQYSCSCVTGYNGTNCEIDIDDCLPRQCENGGTCIDKVNGYLCTCVPGYNGARCEIDIDECASSPCVNGSCIDQVNGFTCTCHIGYYGKRCEADIDYCSSSPCENSGTCTDEVQGYSCSCLPGYDGLLCETEIDECASIPCTNGGTCTDLVNEFWCACVPGFSGTQCEIDIDECAGILCKNNGSCVDNVNGYSCSCDPGFNGIQCEIDFDECASNPCKNDGTCTDNVNAYSCVCVPGYTGKQCEIDVNDCEPDPCENGATCSDNINSFTCSCAYGFQGNTCQTGSQPIVVIAAAATGSAVLLLVLLAGILLWRCKARRRRHDINKIFKREFSFDELGESGKKSTVANLKMPPNHENIFDDSPKELVTRNTVTGLATDSESKLEKICQQYLP